jgi:hypothetical protein
VNRTQTTSAVPGDTVEWVVERSEVSGLLSALADFDTAILTDNGGRVPRRVRVQQYWTYEHGHLAWRGPKSTEGWAGATRRAVRPP